MNQYNSGATITTLIIEGSSMSVGRTDDEIDDVKGLTDFRHYLTQVMNAARNGKKVNITEYGFDRKPLAHYTLTRVDSVSE